MFCKAMKGCWLFSNVRLWAQVSVQQETNLKQVSSCPSAQSTLLCCDIAISRETCLTYKCIKELSEMKVTDAVPQKAIGRFSCTHRCLIVIALHYKDHSKCHLCSNAAWTCEVSRYIWGLCICVLIAFILISFIYTFYFFYLLCYCYYTFCAICA